MKSNAYVCPWLKCAAHNMLWVFPAAAVLTWQYRHACGTCCAACTCIMALPCLQPQAAHAYGSWKAMCTMSMLKSVDCVCAVSSAATMLTALIALNSACSAGVQATFSESREPCRHVSVPHEQPQDCSTRRRSRGPLVTPVPWNRRVGGALVLGAKVALVVLVKILFVSRSSVQLHASTLLVDWSQARVVACPYLSLI
jgi:hypothetical protein